MIRKAQAAALGENPDLTSQQRSPSATACKLPTT
jgi:hypothetical protein